jgi:arylsulfatase
MFRPNVLFIMTDQQRWDALGIVGGWVETPHLDALASGGVLFSHCVTTTPICVPARVTLATGRYPHNNHVWNNIPYTMPATDANWMRELQRMGYRTSLFGKTHLHPHVGDLRTKEDLLHQYGLADVDEIGGPRASAVVGSHMTARWAEKGLLDAYRDDFRDRFSNKPHVARPSVLPLEDYADVYVGQRANDYLRSYDRDQPWFCWVSFGGPHEPWDAPEPFASRYDPATMPAPIPRSAADQPRPQGWLDHYMARSSPAFEAGDVAAMRANYAGNVTLIDDQIGQILATVRDRGEMDDTVIVFTSDHGEMNGDWGLIYKMNFLDGAVRVPLIINTPQTRTRQGIVNDSFAENADVGPTIVELAGGTLDYPQFARSLVPALEGGLHRGDALSEFRGEFMLVNPTFKMAVNREGKAYLLFDRVKDPLESHNVAGLAQYKADEDAMRTRMLERISQSLLKQP